MWEGLNIFSPEVRSCLTHLQLPAPGNLKGGAYGSEEESQKGQGQKGQKEKEVAISVVEVWCGGEVNPPCLRR